MKRKKLLLFTVMILEASRLAYGISFMTLTRYRNWPSRPRIRSNCFPDDFGCKVPCSNKIFDLTNGDRLILSPVKSDQAHPYIHLPSSLNCVKPIILVWKVFDCRFEQLVLQKVATITRQDIGGTVPCLNRLGRYLPCPFRCILYRLIRLFFSVLPHFLPQQWPSYIGTGFTDGAWPVGAGTRVKYLLWDEISPSSDTFGLLPGL